MKHLPILLIGFFLLSCASGDGASDAADSKRTIGDGAPIKVQNLVPYSKKSFIPNNIKSECALETNLPMYLSQMGTNITLADRVNKASAGKTLVLEITGATSSGNAFIGHNKSGTVNGTLYNSGKKVASFTARRISGGGVWGGMKGSCSVLNRVMKAIAKDISVWLASPVDGARLGDA